MFWLSLVVLLTNYGDRQSVWCTKEEGELTTGSPLIVEANVADKIDDGATYLIDPFSRKFRIEIAKKEILRKLGMAKRPPHMDDLRANIPKPVFDGEISALFSTAGEPTKTTQIVIPAEEGLSFLYFVIYVEVPSIVNF